MFKLENCDSYARAGVFKTPHGEVLTPFFMNVATAGAIKGGISAPELSDLLCNVMLCNTYHLHLRPGSTLIRDFGGLHKFTRWEDNEGKPRVLLTDSGGFQVFSLARLAGAKPKISEEGVHFKSHLDGSTVFISPEESMQIQSNFGSTIAMAFDECVDAGASYDYFKNSVARTERWLVRSIDKLHKIRESEKCINKEQMIFGINQGGIFKDIRIENAKFTADQDIDGFAIGGLAVGEDEQDMYRILEYVLPYAPKDKPRYLMGVGTPRNILEAVSRGVDMFDCVMPTRNARHGTVFTMQGIMHLKNNCYKNDPQPIEEYCNCPTCKQFSRAYLRHLFNSNEYLSGRLTAIHNLYFYNSFMKKIRNAIINNTFNNFFNEHIQNIGKLVK